MCHPSASSADPVMHHFSTSLDHVGFFARSVEDVGILLDAHAGHDPDDPGSRASASVPLPSQAASSALDLRIGVVRSVATAAEKDVRDRFEESLSHLEELGADLIDVEPFEGIELKKPVVNPEFAAAHGERFRQSPDLFGEKARRYLELGLETDETVYIEGLEQRKALQRTVEWRIQGIDAIVCPTSLTTAKPIGEDTRAKEDANITIPFNIARLSMAALPNGFSDGLPTSLLIGAHKGHDGTVHNITRALQRVTDHHLTSPPGI